MSNRPHGYARYKLDGCSCYVCGYAGAQYRDAVAQAKQRGTWQPWTDAEPVRTHLLALRACGMGLRTIAQAARVDRQRLQAVLNGRPERGTLPQEKIRPALASAVLSVEPTLETLAPKTVINATGTHRRLQAMVAAGWPQSRIATRLGMTSPHFSLMLRTPRVTVRTARAVRTLYSELWGEDPRRHGVDNQAYSRARNHAASHRWAPDGAWDDDSIDDPAAVPDWTGECGTWQGYNAHVNHGLLPACQPCREANSAYRRERRTAAQQTREGASA